MRAKLAMAVFLFASPAGAESLKGEYLDWHRERQHDAGRAANALGSPAHDAAETLRRQGAWVERCRPRIEPDAAGKLRRVYAAPGCETGP